MRSAAVTFVRAIIAPIERSMPPEITMIACATAAKARGIAPLAIVSRSNGPKVGLIRSVKTRRPARSPSRAIV